MRIIKPYGRSHTKFETGRPRRKLRRNPTRDVPKGALVDVEEFAGKHPELIIAQWISAIDKIAAKPRNGKKPTPQQREFRKKLGEAAFRFLTEKKRLDFSDGDGRLEKLWWSKIHPYGKYDDRGSGWEKGRWYTRFAGDVEVSAVDPAGIVAKVHEHLHEREYRIKPGRPDKRRSRIAGRAEGIAKSVPAQLLRFPNGGHPWSEREEETYKKAGDVATEIRRKAMAWEQSERSRGAFSIRDVAPILYDQYGKLFRDGERTLPVAEARERFRDLFELHGAVKDTYARILKNHRSLKGKKGMSVAHVLPSSMGSLFRLVEAKSDNRDLNALVRLGKVIHYESAPRSDEDTPSHVVANWPEDVADSRYRTSKGQAEIKRTEAFVRVWRNTIALAARTLTDWADPDGKIRGDILLKVEEATGGQFNAAAYDEKLPFLFGDRSPRFASRQDGFRSGVLRLALKGWADLRHSSFHFKGRGGFVKALKAMSTDAEPAVVIAVRNLLEQDYEGRWERLIELLRAAHVEHYFDQEQLDALVGAAANARERQSPLPRFRRVLDRAKNAWNRKPYVLHLPPPDNRSELDKPGRRCRYVAVKTLYERAFPAWLEERPAATLNEWIDRAVQRRTEEAQSINKDELAVAKAKGLSRLDQEDGIADFLDHLSAATATEFRVQRGYDSDADNARKQAKYLDDLRCDVVGQAFEEYLKTAKLSWVLDDLGDGELPEKLSSLEDIPQPASGPAREKPEDWEAVLYFMLHLVPVDAVGRLQHQLRKWSILEKKAAAELEGQPSTLADSTGRIFGLYLDMHDAKFEGGEGMIGAEALKGLFETDEAFSKALPDQPGLDAGRHVPLRGLREILRFGCLQPLMGIFREHGVTIMEVDELAAWGDVSDVDSRIAVRQKEREELHEKCVKNKRPSDRDKIAYCKALADVARHRYLAAHVRLSNHARLHRLLMEVLGRLVDYAGLWERDLYFTTLALMWLRKKKPQDVFDDEGLDFLKKGEVVKAVGRLEDAGDDGKAVVEQLKRLFGKDLVDRKSAPNGERRVVSVRNDLMHFNMLHGQDPVLNLTETVNDARRLMSYDRKLKNAVSQSIKEMVAREGLDLTWEMRGHRLECAKIETRQAVHLRDKKIKENLHGEQFVKMAASLFCGEQKHLDDDVLSIDPDKIEWSQRHGQKPKGGRQTRGNRREDHRSKSRFS